MPGLALIETTGITAIVPGTAHVVAHVKEGQRIAARLVVGADGRRSLCRDAAGIVADIRDYPQTAIACAFSHSRHHGFVSTEFHRGAGPCTTVPLPDCESRSQGALSHGSTHRSSLVWVEQPAEAERLYGLDDDGFGAALQARLFGVLGRVGDIGPRIAFPLIHLRADTLGKNRIALVGEAAHVLPPIGAQGLNLGFRDCAALADIVTAAWAQDRDIGDDTTLAAYRRERAMDVWTRQAAIDLLNRSLISPFIPLQAVRGVGLHLLRAIGPLRRVMMRQGMGSPAVERGDVLR